MFTSLGCNSSYMRMLDNVKAKPDDCHCERACLWSNLHKISDRKSYKRKCREKKKKGVSEQSSWEC